MLICKTPALRILILILAGCMVWGSVSADTVQQDDLVALNASLAAGNILNYCKAREKLLPLTYAELQNLILSTHKNSALKPVRDLLERALPKPEDLYPLIEDIYLNNTPLLSDSPFYGDLLSGAPVTGMKPHAEQIYVDNLKLKYQKNNLIKKEKDLWLGPRALQQKTALRFKAAQDQTEALSWISGQTAKPASASWSWELKDDYRHDFFHSVRQFMKHYEGALVTPVIYKNTVITRNAYKLFCLSLDKAEELWSLGPDNNGQENYHTFRHPHQNSYGNDFLFLNGMVFSELGGKLVAADVTDISRPSLKWERALGEYTLCAKPVVVGDKLICGLVNARGEVWFSGFDVLTGKLIWSSYIGTSSFLAPVCTLDAVIGDQVIIGTNHGVLAALSPDSGEIIWLKKYAPRRYCVADYWWKGYHKDVVLETGSLPFDTQFLKPAGNGLIYYKPRESNYFYTIDAGNGRTVGELYIDPSFLYLLGADDGKAVFLQKGDFPRADTQVVVADLRTGAQLSGNSIPGGKLMGVLYPEPSQVIFKVNETLYGLDLADTGLSLKKIPLRESGWLLGAAEQAVLVGENRSVKCLSFNSKNMRGFGLKPQAIDQQKPSVSKSSINLTATQKGYQVNTGNTVLLGVKVIRGADPTNFFMLLNSGQIVCVGEKGDIRWERKIFFGPMWQSDMKEDKDWHLYSDDIEIYLYDNVLIVNDLVNVIAVDVNTGAYLWSMTNKRQVLNDESQIPSFTSMWSYESRLYFAKQIMMRVQFLDDVLILSHGDTLYALDPATGYSKVSRKSGLSCVMDMRSADGRVYLASHLPHARIKVFDKNLEETGDFSGSAIGENKNAWPQLVFLPNYVLLHISPSVHIFDKKDGRLIHTMVVGDFKRYYIEPYNDGFIVIVPFLQTSGWRLKDGIPQLEWEYPLEPLDQRVVWDLPSLKSAYYLLTKDCVLNFIRRQDDYWLVALDLATGQKQWETKLDGIQGRFHNLSSSIQSKGRLQFILTCLYTSENYKTDLDILSKLVPGSGLYAADLDSVLFSLDAAKGVLLQAERLPSVRLIGFPREDVFQTQNFYQYNVYRTAIRCVAKEWQ